MPGWGSQDVLDYFKRSEKNSDFQVSGDTKHHGKDGPLSVSAVRYTNPLINTFLQASYKAGYAKNDDFNNWDRDQDGVGPFHVAQKDGERSSAASAYLSSVEAEASLSVVTGAQVQKLDICPEKMEAGGVRYVKDGAAVEARVREGGEVILAAGAVGSPQLLMLSGIGPKKHLKGKTFASRFKIQTLFDARKIALKPGCC